MLLTCKEVAGDRIQSISLPCDSCCDSVYSLPHLTSLKMGVFNATQVNVLFESLPRLRHLELTSLHNKVSHEDLSGLTALTELQHLEISCTIAPTVLCFLTGLTALSFDGAANQFMSATAPGICPVLQRYLSRLEVLDLGNCKLFKTQVQCISTMTQLRSLRFGSCKFVSLTLLCRLTRLQSIQCWCKMNSRSCVVGMFDSWSVDGSLKVSLRGSSTCFAVDVDGALDSNSETDEPMGAVVPPVDTSSSDYSSSEDDD